MGHQVVNCSMFQSLEAKWLFLIDTCDNVNLMITYIFRNINVLVRYFAKDFRNPFIWVEFLSLWTIFSLLSGFVPMKFHFDLER